MASTNPDPIAPLDPVISVSTNDLRPGNPAPTSTPAPAPAQSNSTELYPAGSPNPSGTKPGPENDADQSSNADPSTGSGVEGEVTVWEARYSKKNFVGRLAFRILMTVGIAILAYYTWGEGYTQYAVPTWAGLIIVAVLWATLIWRMVQAHLSHYYQLTNRRLFVSTGVFNRRRDMMELMRVKDVFARQQSLMERWLKVGTVEVVPSEHGLPTFYLAGVEDPTQVMDLIWHHARAERDQRSVKVDSV